MANNRVAYGLCKKYNIELPSDATPKEAWEALKKNGISEEQAYEEVSKTYKQGTSYDDIINESPQKAYTEFGDSGITFDDDGEYVVDEDKWETELEHLNNYFGDSIQEFESNINKTELADYVHVMQRYSENFYKVINSSLYENKEMNLTTKHQIRDLDRVISKYSLPEPITVYRCVDSSILGTLGINDINELKGKVFNNKGYSSCSLDQNITKGFMNNNIADTGNKQIIMKIGVNKGKGNCFPLWNYSNYKEEQEMLIKRDSNFSINNVYEEDGVYYLEGEMQ